MVSVHISLDGFVTDENGKMDWIKVDEQLFDYIVNLTDQADTALYGRTTYEMMDGYWPHAGEQPDASRHDVEHSKWYNRVNKVVISHSMKGHQADKTQVIGENLVEQIMELKQQPGEKILMLGSPTAAKALMQNNLIDEYWLFLNPVLLGSGKPFFDRSHRLDLKLVGTRVFDSGVIELHYEK